jgi:hypothetical protein
MSKNDEQKESPKHTRSSILRTGLTLDHDQTPNK